MTNKEAVRAFIASRGMDAVRNSNGTIYSVTNVIYSYGHHYPAASFGGNLNEILVNEHRYSNTTSHHTGLIRREAEAAGIKVILTPYVNSITDMGRLEAWVNATMEGGR